MRSILTVAMMMLSTGCVAQESKSGSLEDLKWGMTAAQVIETLDGRARAQRGDPDSNGQLGVVSMEQFSGQQVPVGFFFRDGKLVSYGIKFDDGFQACQTRRSQIDALYGEPFYKAGNPPSDVWANSVWYAAATLPGQVELMSMGLDADASCKLTFMDEMAPNARDAEGLTRNEGHQTPRADYQPYRPN